MKKQNKKLELQDYSKSLSQKINWKICIPESANSSLQFQHAVIDMTCKYMQVSLCGKLMATSHRINVSLLRRGNVRVEGER